jgi:hypothetical protein
MPGLKITVNTVGHQSKLGTGHEVKGGWAGPTPSTVLKNSDPPHIFPAHRCPPFTLRLVPSRST